MQSTLHSESDTYIAYLNVVTTAIVYACGYIVPIGLSAVKWRYMSMLYGDC